MDIWEKMYEEAQKLYNPHEVSDFVYANHVVAAVEAEDGQIFTGFCMEGTCGVFHLCAERVALFNMYQFSGQTKVKKVLAFETNHLMVEVQECPVAHAESSSQR